MFILYKMKIVCISKHNGTIELHLKPDTAMLINNKPLFIPDFTNDLRSLPCLILRISRLGRNIAARFGARYFDATTVGLDFRAYDRLNEARTNRQSLSPWVAFDGSLALGNWQPVANGIVNDIELRLNGSAVWQSRSSNWVCRPEEAIAMASSYFKLAQGDWIAIAADTQPQQLEINDHIEIVSTTEENTNLLRMNIK